MDPGGCHSHRDRDNFHLIWAMIVTATYHTDAYRGLRKGARLIAWDHKR